MNILNINSSLDSISGGGTTERTIQLSLNLAMEENFDVSILTLDTRISDSVFNQLHKINVIKIPCINKRFLVPSLFNNQIADSIKKADIIHLMSHWSVINLISYYWIQKYNKPYVVCPAGALPIYGRSKIIKKIYNLVGGRALIKNANVNIAITEDEIENFYDYQVNSKKITVIPNGIDSKAFKYKNDQYIRDKFHLTDNPFILFVGRLNYIKGPDLLLKAFSNIEKKFPNYNLIFLGPDNHMKNGMILESIKLEIQNKVKFIGYQDGQVKSMFYHAAELLVIPSRSEAMSIVVLEAAITETPVLMTTSCGLEELTGRNGAVAVNPDTESITNGISQMLENTNDFPTRGQNLKRYVESKFMWEIVIKKYVGMFKNI